MNNSITSSEENLSSSLCQAHYHMLSVESSISDEIIAARGYRTATKKVELRDLGFPPFQQRVPALVVPSLDGRGELRGYQTRPNAPRISRDGRMIKYESRYGDTVIADVNPLVRCHIDDPRKPIVFTEGVKKADSVASRGVCSVALLGVYGFRWRNENGGKVAIPDFEYFALNGRRVYIAFDSDVMINPMVYLALLRIKKLLELWEAKVLLIYLPSGDGGAKQGLDDFLACGHTIDDLFALATNELKAAPGDGERPSYFLTSKDTVKESQANLEIMLEQEADWKGRLSYNLFAQTAEVDGRQITDHDRHLITSWSSHNLELAGARASMRDAAIDVVARKRTHDPLKTYVESLPPWDGTPRIQAFFTTYCGAEDSDENRWCGRTMLVQMIARALNPGCMARYVFILEGPQSLGKTQLVRALAGEWYVSLSMSLDSKEAAMMIQGIWVAEFEEMGSMRKSQIEHINAFVSARDDAYIPKFANDRAKHPRRTVFIGTVNPDDYLVDQTGDSRWFPIEVTAADEKGVERDRDLLIAEARDWYLLHKGDWWVLTPEVEDLINETRQRKHGVNPYEEKIHEWIARHKKTDTYWAEIAEACLELPPGIWKDKVIQGHATDALKKLGWTKKKGRVEGKRGTVMRWFSPDHKVTEGKMSV